MPNRSRQRSPLSPQHMSAADLMRPSPETEMSVLREQMGAVPADLFDSYLHPGPERPTPGPLENARGLPPALREWSPERPDPLDEPTPFERETGIVNEQNGTRRAQTPRIRIPGS